MESENEDYSDMDELIPEELVQSPKVASHLTATQLSIELETRNVKSTGFWNEDHKLLQDFYVKEHEELLARFKKQQLRIQRQQEKEQMLLEEKEKNLRLRQRENKAVRENPKVEFWFELLRNGQSRNEATFCDFNPELTRVLSRILPTISILQTLDLSHSHIGDKSGTLLVRGISGNKYLKKVELENTKLGVNSAKEFQHLLTSNTALVHLNLENNSLTNEHTDYSGIHALADGLQRNTTLSYLNLWRTDLGSLGGEIISKALGNNKTLITLATGSNGIQISDEKSINEILERNKGIQNLKEKHRLLELRKLKEKERREQQLEAIEQKKREEEEWLLRRKMERAEARRKQKEYEEMERLEQERLRQEEQGRKAAEEKRLAELKKKKRKKKKKKK